MEIVIAIVLGFVVGGLAFLIGTKVGNKLDKQLERKVKLNKQLERKVESLQQTLDSAPMVIECQIGQPLTVDQMSMDVVGPNLIKIWRHFRKGLYTIPSTDQIAKAMLQWYNPDSLYTKLVIVGWLRGGEIKIAWTWQEQDPKLIVTKDAVNGFVKYYESALGNPMLLGNKEE